MLKEGHDMETLKGRDTIMELLGGRRVHMKRD
jgi:hypothetical protein